MPPVAPEADFGQELKPLLWCGVLHTYTSYSPASTTPPIPNPLRESTPTAATLRVRRCGTYRRRGEALRTYELRLAGSTTEQPRSCWWHACCERYHVVYEPSVFSGKHEEIDPWAPGTSCPCSSYMIGVTVRGTVTRLSAELSQSSDTFATLRTVDFGACG